LKEHCVNDVTQTEMHTDYPLITERISFELITLLKILNAANCQVLTTFRQSWCKQQVIYS